MRGGWKRGKNSDIAGYKHDAIFEIKVSYEMNV